MNRQEQAAIHLRKLGYGLVEVRKAMLALTGKTETELAERCGVARPTIGMHMLGLRRANLRVQALIAQEMGVRPELIWREWEDLKQETGAVLRPEGKQPCECTA